MSLKTNRRKRTVVVVLITTMNALFLVLMLTDFDKNSNALVQSKRSLHSAEVAIGADLLSLFPELTNVSLNDLEPVLLTPRRKMRKKLVVGIPVVERKRNYILETLTSLLGELDEFHRKDILFLVMFGCRQSSSDFVTNTTASIRRKFAKDIDDGLLQVAAIPTAYYKINIDDVPSTFDDSSQRMQWRTKQSIDYIYLMAYARTLGDHYMQLEDDVVAAASYARVIFNYLAFNGDKRWFYIEFSKIGFIGKLFRARELGDVVKAIALYYRYKPVDWILFDIIHCRYCRPDKGATDCTKVIKTAIIYSGAPQFQHVGTVSSLQGKQQTIRDANFGKGKAQGTRDNPLAKVNSTMKYRSGYEPERGYANNNAIWFQNVVKGGHMIVTFSPPITITGIMLLSGMPPAAKGKFGPETEVYISFDGSGEANKTLIGAFFPSGDFLFRSCLTAVKSLQIEVTEDLHEDVVVDHFIIDTGFRNCQSATNKREVDVLLPLSIESVSKWS